MLLGVRGIHSALRIGPSHGKAGVQPRPALYFPMQKVEKIRFRTSSLVVSPVSSSRASRAR